MIKFRVVRLLRRAGLLRFADRVKFELERVRAWRRNRRFERMHPDFATPPAHLAFDALNHVDWFQYRDSGLVHARMFARVIAAQMPGEATLDILEWGCGPARLVRHLPALLSPRPHTLTGSDYNAETIAWCRAHISGCHFVQNTLDPPLPFPDRAFDVVYNFSVFTHLSEPVQLAWAAELRRVLRPGGLLVCTTHGDAYRYLLAGDDERGAFDAGRVVVQGRYQEGRKWFFAIHPAAFVRERLLEGWEGVLRLDLPAGDAILQDVWIARRPRDP